MLLADAAATAGLGAPIAPVPPRCFYPGSYPTSAPIQTMLASIVKMRSTSFYLDTVEAMKGGLGHGENHHQGLARSHNLSDGSIYFFLAHSDLDSGSRGSISVYRYAGPTDGGHILETKPLTVAPMQQMLMLNDEHHPSDICFVPDMNGADSGYLFATHEYEDHQVVVYRWAPNTPLAPIGSLQFETNGPNLLFVDKVGGSYYLGVASTHWPTIHLFSASCEALFPSCAKGSMNVAAFQPVQPKTGFAFPVNPDSSQMKLVRDSLGDWYLFGFRGDPSSDPHGTDYVDLYRVTFAPSFSISSLIAAYHVNFKSGDTGFANTGTHHVDPSGRLLISSSYRWAEDEGPGKSGYVSRVDEIPSW